jgi:hypothetical protein
MARAFLMRKSSVQMVDEIQHAGHVVTQTRMLEISLEISKRLFALLLWTFVLGSKRVCHLIQEVVLGKSE